MKIVVCVKLVPDSAAKVTAQNGQAQWGDAPLILNPWDEYAVEAALLQAEAHGGEVTAISLGDDRAKEALKQALAMGCSAAVLVNDPALAKTDSQVTARVLAAAIQKIGAVDMAVFGKQAIDSDTGLTPPQTARLLGWPSLTLVTAITALDPASGAIQVERGIEEGRQTVASKLPAVVSVLKDIAEPRYPSFLGIRKASKAVIPTWSLADLNISEAAPAVSWPVFINPPQRAVQTEIISGGSPQEIAEKLADKILAEKVL